MSRENLLGKRKKRLDKNPNPLFMQWLRDWKEGAENRGLKTKYIYATAMKNLRKYPLPIRSGKDCKFIKGFGDKICDMLDKKLKEHNAAQLQTANDEMSIQNGRLLITTTSSKTNSSQTGEFQQNSKSRPYVPKKGSMTYAVLTTLYEAHISDCDHLVKEELLQRSQESAENMSSMPSQSQHTSRAAITTLLKKGLIVEFSNPTRFSLTEAGIELAAKLFKVNNTNNSKPNLNRSNSAPSNSYATDSGSDIPVSCSQQSSLSSCSTTSKRSHDHDLSDSDSDDSVEDLMTRLAKRSKNINALGRGQSPKQKFRQPTLHSFSPDRLKVNEDKVTEKTTDSNTAARKDIGVSSSSFTLLNSIQTVTTQADFSDLGDQDLFSSFLSSASVNEKTSDLAQPVTGFWYVTEEGTTTALKDKAAVCVNERVGVGFLILCNKSTLSTFSGPTSILENPSFDAKTKENMVYVYISDDEAPEFASLPSERNRKSTASPVPTCISKQLPLSCGNSDTKDEQSNSFSSKPSLSLSGTSEFVNTNTETYARPTGIGISDSCFRVSNSQTRCKSNATSSYKPTLSLSQPTKTLEYNKPTGTGGNSGFGLSSVEAQLYDTSLGKATLSLSQPIDVAMANKKALEYNEPTGTGLSNCQSVLSSDAFSNRLSNSERCIYSESDVPSSSKASLYSSKPASSTCTAKSLTSDIPVADSQLIPAFTLEAGQFEIVLVVDNREYYGASSKQSLLPELLKNGVKTDVRQLNVGDFAWIAKEIVEARSDQLKLPKGRELVLDPIIERKRIDDLAASIKDGRFLEQKYRMKHCGLKHPIYLIEDLPKRGYVGIQESALEQAVFNTQVIDGFKLKRTKNTRDSVAYLTVMTRYLQRLYSKKRLHALRIGDFDKRPHFDIEQGSQFLMPFDAFNSLAVKSRSLSVKDMFAAHLLQIRGVSIDKVYTIIGKFSTPTELRLAYSACTNEKEKESLLSGLKVGDTKRTIGPSLSKQICMVYDY